MSEVKLNILLRELHRIDWKSLGLQLGVPEPQIRTIQMENPHSSSMCLSKVLIYWMDDSSDISWASIAAALQRMHQQPLADEIIRRYCRRSCTVSTDRGDDPSSDPKSIEVSIDVKTELTELNLSYSMMVANVKRFMLNCLDRWLHRNKIKAHQDFISFVATYLNLDRLDYTFEGIFNELYLHTDPFKVDTMKVIINHYFRAYSRRGADIIRDYECAVHRFFKHSRISQLKDKVTNTLPHFVTDKTDVLSIILNCQWDDVSWSLLERLLKKVFGVYGSILLDPVVTYGSVRVEWRFRREFREIMKNLARESEGLLKEEGLIELMIGNEVVIAGTPVEEEVTVIQEELEMCQAFSSTKTDNLIVSKRRQSKITPQDVAIFKSLIRTHSTDSTAPDDHAQFSNHPLALSSLLSICKSEGSSTAGTPITEDMCRVHYEHYYESLDPSVFAASSTAESYQDLWTVGCPSCHAAIIIDGKSSFDYCKCFVCDCEFCMCCEELYSATDRKECKRMSSCKESSNHVHHKRNCLYHLCEFPPERLAKLLKDNKKHYQTHFHLPSDQSSSADNDNDGDNDDDDTSGSVLCAYVRGCNRHREGESGLCSYHYRVYLGGLIRENGLDPADISEVDELNEVIKREGVPPLERGGLTSNQYHQKLIQYVKDQLPLNNASGPDGCHGGDTVKSGSGCSLQ